VLYQASRDIFNYERFAGTVLQRTSEVSVWTSKLELHPLSWAPDQLPIDWFGELTKPFTHWPAKVKGARSFDILVYLAPKKCKKNSS
jgi:hypothetical protein